MGDRTVNPLELALTFDDSLRDRLLESGGRILLVFALALVAVNLLSRVLRPLLRVAVREHMTGETDAEVRKRTETLEHVVNNSLVVLVLGVAFVTVLPEFGISAGPLIAGLGLVGLAIGFGAQSLVKDVINGVFILTENQFARGDVVEIGGVSGLVEDINLRRTVLRDLDGAVHFVPHSAVETVSNFTKEYSRVNLNIGVAYDSDLDKVIAVINQVGEELAADASFASLIRQAPRVLRVEKFGDVAIELKVVADTEPMEQWTVAGELRLRLKKAFDREGIAMPVLPTTIHNV